MKRVINLYSIATLFYCFAGTVVPWRYSHYSVMTLYTQTRHYLWSTVSCLQLGSVVRRYIVVECRNSCEPQTWKFGCLCHDTHPITTVCKHANGQPPNKVRLCIGLVLAHSCIITFTVFMNGMHAVSKTVDNYFFKGPVGLLSWRLDHIVAL